MLSWPLLGYKYHNLRTQITVFHRSSHTAQSWKLSIEMAEQDLKSDVMDWIDRVEFTKLPPGFHSLSSPWRVSQKVDKHEIINKILAHSLVVQSSRIPQSSHPNLPNCIFSNGCVIICELLRYYLSWLDIVAKVYCGTMNKGRGNGIMHVFLEIGSEIVDNAYIYVPQVRKFSKTNSRFLPNTNWELKIKTKSSYFS